jgi:hypothetical protein
MLLRQRTEVLCSFKQRLEEANAELDNLSTTDPLYRPAQSPQV